MSEQVAFVYPPDWGNAVALVVWYACFLGFQIALGAWYLRRWNWTIFLGLVVFLILLILDSVAYLKLHYAPVTGSWYSLWLFALSAGPAFFIASLHISMWRVLQDARSGPFKFRILQLSPRTYIFTCLGIDLLALVLTIIGAAYAGAKAHVSAAASKPGYDIMTAAMAIQAVDLAILLVIGVEAAASFRRHQRKCPLATESTEEIKAECPDQTPSFEKSVKRPSVVLGSLLTLGILLLAETIIRAVDVAGGFEGPLQVPVLPNVENIFLFVAILVITALHPAVHI